MFWAAKTCVLPAQNICFEWFDPTLRIDLIWLKTVISNSDEWYIIINRPNDVAVNNYINLFWGGLLKSMAVRPNPPPQYVLRVGLNRRNLTDARLFDAFGMVNECRKGKSSEWLTFGNAPLRRFRSTLFWSCPLDTFFGLCHRRCPLEWQGALRMPALNSQPKDVQNRKMWPSLQTTWKNRHNVQTRTSVKTTSVKTDPYYTSIIRGVLDQHKFTCNMPAFFYPSYCALIKAALSLFLCNMSMARCGR